MPKLSTLPLTIYILNTLYVCGYTTGQQTDGKVFISEDDGTTWTSILTAANTFFYSLSFLDINIGMVAGGAGGAGVIYKTVDGGDNWTSSILDISVANTLRDINLIELASSNPNTRVIGAWAVGEASTVIKTLDGGANWTKDAKFIPDQGAGHYLLAVVALSEELAFAAGDAEGEGNFYFFISDTINGVKYIYSPVDSVWITVTNEGNIKQGFVAALTV